MKGHKSKKYASLNPKAQLMNKHEYLERENVISVYPLTSGVPKGDNTL